MQYDEAQVGKSKLYTKKIEAMHPLLLDLHKVSKNLSFKRSTLAAALGMLFDEKAGTWSLDTEHKASWTTTMTNRLSNACRQCSQGCLRTPNVAWVRNLPWRQGGEPMQAKAAEPRPCKRTSASASGSVMKKPTMSSASSSKPVQQG
ncbi:MAG: hypothetical protein GY772_30225, partial [bacterium]|nr:hypothetical protein [bacterium]